MGKQIIYVEPCYEEMSMEEMMEYFDTTLSPQISSVETTQSDIMHFSPEEIEYLQLLAKRSEIL